jgi:hypothetical protein
MGSTLATAVAMEWVIRRGSEHACDACGWAGQSVRAALVDGEVVAQTCVDEEGCAEGVMMGEMMLLAKEEEYTAQDRAEMGLGWA